MEPQVDGVGRRKRPAVVKDTSFWGEEVKESRLYRWAGVARGERGRAFALVFMAVGVVVAALLLGIIPQFGDKYPQRMQAWFDTVLALATVTFACVIYLAFRKDRLRADLDGFMDVHFVYSDDSNEWVYAVSAYEVPVSDSSDLRTLAQSAGRMALDSGNLPLGPYVDVVDCGVYKNDYVTAFRYVVHIPLYRPVEDLIAALTGEAQVKGSVTHVALLPSAADERFKGDANDLARGIGTLALSERRVRRGVGLKNPPLRESLNAEWVLMVPRSKAGG